MSTANIDSLPIIDIAPLLNSDPADEGKRANVSAALHSACVEFGFFYLDIRAFVDPSEPEELARLGREFFLLPQEEKDKISLKNQDHARGYAKLHENVTNGKADNHEGIDFYRPVENPDKTKSVWGENQWPTVTGFREKYEIWVDKMKQLGLILMEAMSLGLGMTRQEWKELRSQVDDSFWVMRVIGYPPLPNDHDGISCGAHKDYGCLTFLYADPTPNALQVFLRRPGAVQADTSGLPQEQGSEEGVWISADPIPGCVVCNIGEMWEVWTNGLYRSTLHRVIHRGSNYRVSVPFFFEPNFDALVKPLAAVSRIREKQNLPPGPDHKSVVYGEFLVGKVGNNFDKDGEKKGKYIARAVLASDTCLLIISRRVVNLVLGQFDPERVAFRVNDDPSRATISLNGHFPSDSSSSPLNGAASGHGFDVSFGPVAPGSMLTRARDAAVSFGMLPLAVVQAERGAQTGFGVARFRSQAEAVAFIDNVNGAPSTTTASWASPSDYAAISSLSIRVSVWNINGDLLRRITAQSLRDFITDRDITFFLETFLYAGQEDVLDVPSGYHAVARCRPWRSGMRIPGGGVAAIIKNTVHYKVCDELSFADCLVVDLHTCYLVGAYWLPESSRWEDWSEVNPRDKIAEILACCTRDVDKPMLLMGDLNARTGSLQAAASPFPRHSADATINTRGRWLIDACNVAGAVVLNGTSLDRSSPDTSGWTSFQGARMSVIDYIVASSSLLKNIDAVYVDSRVGRFDHASLSVEIEISQPPCSIPTPTSSTSESAPAPPARLSLSSIRRDKHAPSTLDDLLRETMERKTSANDAVQELYGPVYFVDRAIVIYLSVALRVGTHPEFLAYASTRDAQSTPMVTKWRIRLDETGGYFLALTHCLINESPNRALSIHIPSHAVLKSLVGDVIRVSSRGWPGVHGAILKTLVTVLRSRAAATTFHLLHATDQSASWHAVREAAFRALDNDATPIGHLPLTVPDYWSLPVDTAPIRGGLKVSTSMPLAPRAVSGTSDSLRLKRELDRIAHRNDANHRGRWWKRQKRSYFRKILLDASQSSSKLFWHLIRYWQDAKRRGPQVSLDQLKESFLARMNPQSPLPISFNIPVWTDHQRRASSLPSTSLDKTPELHFSPPFRKDELEWVKARLALHGSSSSTGVDHVSYGRILEMPNVDLANLFNTCVSTCDAPHVWLTSILIGILKPGKPALDPESYRLIALESCLLKVLTLLIAKRFRDWADQKGLIPDAQNGFREGFRTNNCSFVLRSAIDRSRANGTSLFVTYVDLQNAFPSTNQSTLWLKLQEWGAEGPMMDWMRMLYARMEYVVALSARDEVCSESFTSTIGILAGDSISPDFFTAFISDCKPPTSDSDIELYNRCIGELLEADDILFLSGRVDGLQAKLSYLAADYCPVNFLLINARKTKGMIFGPLPRCRPDLFVMDQKVEWVDSFKYVGTTFRSTHRNIFISHYTEKVKKAQKCFYGIFGMDAAVGSLPIQEALRLYMARVDPHLIQGCEVVIDVDKSCLQLLESVQIAFLRRILRFSKHSMIAILFTETGIMPIRYRRMILALRFLRYLILLPSKFYAKAAFEDEKLLLLAGRQGWLGDIKFALNALPVPVVLHRDHFETIAGCDLLIAQVERSCASWLHSCIENSPRLPLLHKRVRPPTVPSLTSSLRCRPYLSVSVAKHRRALLRLMTSNHLLAVERLRYKDRYHNAVERQFRLCRFCRTNVEDEPHALWECEANAELVDLRKVFIADGKQLLPMSSWVVVPSDRYAFTRYLANNIKIVDSFARFTFHVLRIFSSREMFRVPVDIC